MKKGFWLVVKATIGKADVVLEILDARMVELTRNQFMENYAKNLGKKLILVINKIDIVSEETIKKIKKRYSHQDYALVSSKMNEGIGRLIGSIKGKTKKDKLKVAVIGYPNTGKSFIINRLSKKGRARTSSESGFTKGVQLIAGKGDMMLIDTPGVIPYEDRKELLLGLVSAISPSKLEDPEIVAYELLKIFKENNPSVIEDAYGLDMGQSPEDILVQFAEQKNLLRKGAVPDERRAAIQLLIDWHKGKIRI